MQDRNSIHFHKSVNINYLTNSQIRPPVDYEGSSNSKDLGTKILVPKKTESPRGGASRYAGGHGGLQAPCQGVCGAGSPPGTAGGLGGGSPPVKTILCEPPPVETHYFMDTLPQPLDFRTVLGPFWSQESGDFSGKIRHRRLQDLAMAAPERLGPLERKTFHV